jgi:hypothetical protein
MNSTHDQVRLVATKTVGLCKEECLIVKYSVLTCEAAVANGCRRAKGAAHPAISPFTQAASY